MEGRNCAATVARQFHSSPRWKVETVPPQSEVTHSQSLHDDDDGDGDDDHDDKDSAADDDHDTDNDHDDKDAAADEDDDAFVGFLQYQCSFIVKVQQQRIKKYLQ